MLTYDEIWKTFLDNYKVNDEDLPQTDQAIYNDIQNAVAIYNNRVRAEVVADDATEEITGEFPKILTKTDTRLLIAHILKLVFDLNRLTLYESLYRPFSQDVGVRTYNSQMNSLRNSVQRQELYIEKFLFNAQEDFL